MFAAQAALQNRRRGSTQVLSPASIVSLRPALVQVVKELVQEPPTDDELQLLTEVASRAEELEPEQIEVKLSGTRLWELLKVLARNDVRILNYIMVLLMIYDIFFRPQPTPPAPPPPQVTVNVTNVPPEVPTDEIVDEIVEQLKHELDAPEHHPKHLK
jgi:hypothetical protein